MEDHLEPEELMNEQGELKFPKEKISVTKLTYLKGKHEPPEGVKFLIAAGYTHNQACEKLNCCKGCYAPGQGEYCFRCFNYIYEDFEDI